MITGVGSVPIFVSDQERTLAFFRDKLGFKVAYDYKYGPEFRWLGMAHPQGGTEIVLFHPVPSVVGDRAEELKKRIGTWTGIVLLTDDIEQTCRSLSEQGVEFSAGPRQQPWGGWEAVFTDPDGNEFHLVQRPQPA